MRLNRRDSAEKARPDWLWQPHAWPETLYIWLLDQSGQITATLSESGGGWHVSVPLPDIARAIVTTGATHLVMAHSHPSGDPRPSEADVAATRQVWRLARALGASLQDHVIVGVERRFSFRANGLL
ncbi:MAG: JAB domain-containing protein [Sphingobium sp.]